VEVEMRDVAERTAGLSDRRSAEADAALHRLWWVDLFGDEGACDEANGGTFDALFLGEVDEGAAVMQPRPWRRQSSQTAWS
jgi:hypothetical protein